MFRRALFGVAILCVSTVTLRSATIDTTTQGNWIGVYGNDGYILNDYLGTSSQYIPTASPSNDLVSLPSYISSYSYSAGTQQYQWETSTNDPRAPENPLDPSGSRVAATSFDGSNYTVTLNVSQAHAFKLSVYALDWDTNGRDITLSVDGDPVEVNNTGAGGAPSNAYHNGEWVSWTVDAPVGPLTIDINYNGGVNGVISAITFTAVPEPSSLAALGGLAAMGIFFVGRRQKT